jgi:UDPglucose--hexose-1-phosphate uridylyltransferase
MPKNWCPFCPGSGRVPEEGFSVLRYPNDFPALSQTPPEPDDVGGGLFTTRPAYGKCEVLLYSDKHTVSLGELSDNNVHDLADMWYDCFTDMSHDDKIKYIYLFENRGEPVGVTMPHPHGQAYGYSFIPKKIAEELDGAKEYKQEHDSCIFCDLLAQEQKDGRRIIFENEYFSVYAPFFSPITYGVHVTAKRHVPHIAAMTTQERHCLGETLRDCAGTYDKLFDLTFPYMMCMHNAPPGGAYDDYYHFHVEFYPPLRAADKQQYFASSETGAGAWCIPNSPEEKAAELREAYARYQNK